MKWINTEIKLGEVFDPETNTNKDIIRKIPDDICHLEISKAIDMIKSHPSYKYIYFITENLDDKDSEDNVTFWDAFLIKTKDDQIAITDYKVTDYVRR